MTPEEIEAYGIAHSSTVKILQKAENGKGVTLKEFLMLYIDDMESDGELMSWCKTERERALAYAIIALNTRIMNDADPMEMYDLMINNKPIADEDFDLLKEKMGLKGFVDDGSEEDE